jgi:hypothetical protein
MAGARGKVRLADSSSLSARTASWGPDAVCKASGAKWARVTKLDGVY